MTLGPLPVPGICKQYADKLWEAEMFAVSILSYFCLFSLNSSYWDTPIYGFSRSDTPKCEFPYDNLWISLGTPQERLAHGDAREGSRLCGHQPAVWLLGKSFMKSRSPDFQNASGMFQTQVCDSQLPHLGLGTVQMNGRIQAFGWKRLAQCIHIKVCFNIQYLYEYHV